MGNGYTGYINRYLGLNRGWSICQDHGSNQAPGKEPDKQQELSHKTNVSRRGKSIPCSLEENPSKSF